MVLPADKSRSMNGCGYGYAHGVESYGIDAGQPLVLHGVKVGQVLERKLTAKGVTFHWPPEYRDRCAATTICR